MDEYQREIEKEYRKNQIAYELYVQKGEFDKQNNIEEYANKKALDYNYGIQEYADKAAIDVSKAQTKANINVSEYAQKQAIKEAYGQTTPQNKVETEQTNKTENTNNTNAPKVKTADEIANETFKSLQDTLGKLDSNTAPLYSMAITTLHEEGLSDDIMLKLYSKIEKYINPTNETKTNNVANNAMSPLVKRLANSK